MVTSFSELKDPLALSFTGGETGGFEAELEAADSISLPAQDGPSGSAMLSWTSLSSASRLWA